MILFFLNPDMEKYFKEWTLYRSFKYMIMSHENQGNEGYTL